MRVPAGPTDWSWRTRTRRPRGKSAVNSDVVDATGGHPVDARSRVDIRADDVPDGINAADHAAGLSSSLDNLAASVERWLPRSTVLVATATIRVVATEVRSMVANCSEQATTRADRDPQRDAVLVDLRGAFGRSLRRVIRPDQYFRRDHESSRTADVGASVRPERLRVNAADRRRGGSRWRVGEASLGWRHDVGRPWHRVAVIRAGTRQSCCHRGP